jgi:hypothetical protein
MARSKHTKQPLMTKRNILILGVFLMSVGFICNQWLLTALFSQDGVLSPRSVRIIWLFDAVLVLTGLALVVSRSLASLFNIYMGLFFTVLLLYGAERVFYRLNHPAAQSHEPPPPPVVREGGYMRDFFQPSVLLGYKPRPNAQVDSIKKQGDNVIYDVIYSIDAYSRRITPADNLEQRDRFILFFGDSFVFGEGVNDDETLPFYVSQMAPRYKVYNYGFSGYGPQEMLAKLQSDDLAHEVTETQGLLVYVFIDAHVERAIGSMYVYNSWGEQMPYYTLNWQGELVRQGNFTTGRPLLSGLFWFLGQSEIAKYYRVNIPAKLTSSHYGLTARIIAEARNTFQAKYNHDDFYVVIYSDEGDYFEDMLPYFEQFGLKILNYDERLKLNSDEGLAIAGDGHPTGKAHRIVAGWIVTDLGIGTDMGIGAAP